jgi:hypothetical protein
MIYSIETGFESCSVEQKYNAAKPPSAPPLIGITWHYNTGYRDGRVPLVRKEGAMKSSFGTWGAPTGTGEDKYVTHGWPTQPGFIPATSFIMLVADPLPCYPPCQFKVSRPDGAWFMIAASWDGAPALPERQCRVSVTSGLSLPRGFSYQPIMLTADEWARGGSGGSMSLATMKIEPL